MNYYNAFILVLPGLISYCLCEITEDTKAKLLSDFINYYNLQPNHNQASDGYLQSVLEIVPATYKIEVSFAINENDKQKLMKCFATVKEGEKGIDLVNNALHCSEDQIVPIEEVLTSGDQTVNRQIPGGIKEEDPNDPKYKQLAKESLQKYLLDSGNHQPHEVIKVEKVTSQVVSGFLTEIDFLAREIDNTNYDAIKCHSKIWEQSWLNKKDISVTCQNVNQRVKRQDTGGITEQDPTQPKYKQLAKESLQKYILDSGNTHQYEVLKVDKVTSQVVAGSLTRIDFVAKETDKPDDDTIKCHSEIWEQPWLNKKNITVSCQNVNQRAKRQVPGGITEEDPNKPLYKQLAKESLQKYIFESGNTHQYEVLKVDKVTSQVVAGFLTRIDFVAKETDKPDDDAIKCHSEILEQSWLNKKDITVSCQNFNQRVKRQDTGGITEQDPTQPKYKQLAKESLQKYILDSGNTHQYEVLKVDKVTSQLVAGSLTRIDFVAKETDKPDDDAIKCHSEIWEQSWLNKKDITVSCQNVNQRAKRQVLGGITEEDPNKPLYKQLAKESLQKYILESGNIHQYEVLKVDKVTSQLVAGSLTRIDFVAKETDKPDDDAIKCHSEIWEQSWLNKKDITVSCQNVNQRVKRQIPGGITEEDPNKPLYKQLAKESLQKYIFESGNTHQYEVLKVDKVTSQVVAGFLTRIDFVAKETDKPDDDAIKCHSEILEQSWLNKKDITVSCQNVNQRVNGQDTGGITEQDPTQPKYKQLAKESLQKYILDSGNTHQYEVLKVDKVTSQVVAGSLTRIDFVAKETDKPDDDTIKCHSEIWEQPWLNKKNITVSCQNVNQRAKRQIPGGITEEDPNKPLYKQLAKESLQKYIFESGNTHQYEVLKVDKVTSQVVAGFLTRIDFVAKETDKPDDDAIKCHSEILEQSWLNKKDITVSCQNVNQRVKRQDTGGITEQDPTQPKYKQLAKESLQKYIFESGNTHQYEVLKVDKVTSQLVAGSLTRIDFVAKETDKPDDDAIKCHSEIWEQSWLNKKDITVSCQNVNQRAKRQVLGGITEEDPNKPLYKQLAKESLQKYILESGNIHQYEVLKVDKVTFQLVAGSLTRIDFVAKETDKPDDDAIKCHSKIWEQSWLNKKDITVSCQNVNQRVKRQDTGGITEQDPTQPKYKQLAKESLQKYILDSGNTHQYEVLKVDKVTSQVVAGSLTRIDFVAKETDKPDDDTIKCHSEIWEQPWLNKKNITVSCQNVNQRAKRQIPGGITEEDPNKPLYKQLAKESLQKYIFESGNTHQYEVLKVDKVTSQVVAGFLTRIDFVAKETDKPDDDAIKCHSEILEQSWLNKKDITVSCQNVNQRAKRQIPGGITEEDPNKPLYKQLAKESLQKYIFESGNTHQYEVLKVDKVTSQVVAGFLTRIDFVAKETDKPDDDPIKCHSEILEQSWLNKKDITVSCQNVNQRVKRQDTGGITEQDPTQPKYKQLAKESLQKYIFESGNTHQYEVLKVDKVTSQLVAGSLTRIDFVAKETDKPDDDAIKCHSEIWEQSWLNKKDITVSCQNVNQRVKRQIPGGITEEDPNKPLYKQLAKESLQKYILESGNTHQYEVLKVDKVTSQVVAGSLTRIDFVAKETDKPDDDTIKCHSEIWEQPWLNKKNITVSCQNVNQRAKRQIPGGITEEDPNKPLYKQLAKESLQKYIFESGNTHQYEVLKVDKVTSQVVAGFLTRIDFVAKETDKPDDDAIKCHSEILEQSWLNKKDITVSCQNVNQRAKRQIPGGITEEDPNKPLYKQLAKESLQKYIFESGNTHQYEVLKVDKVTSQVVAGFLTRIDFVAKETDKPDDDPIKCHSEILEQSWLNKKDITVSCQNVNQRVKRQDTGGITEQDPTQPKYKQLAKESLQKYIFESGNTHQYEVLKVDKVTSQLVAGSLTRIDFVAKETDKPDDDAIKCHSEIWEQSWLNKKDITVSCQNVNQRVKRQIPGGITEEDPNKPLYKQLAKESLQKYIFESGNTHQYEVLKVDKVTSQVVAGFLTRIDFVAKETDKPDDDAIKCHSAILEQSWLNKKDITVSCQNVNQRVKRQDTGGITEQDPTQPKYKQLAKESLQKYIFESGNTHQYEVLKVDKVTSQLVAGSLTRIDFVAKETDKPDDDAIKCHSEIWEQSWLNKKDITVSCQNVNQRVKRQDTGGITEEDPNKPLYKQLAKESLQKYILESGNTHQYEVLKVDKVTCQVVAGFLTRIDFVAKETDKPDDDAIKCHSEILEQSWLNKKDITVSCQNVNQRVKRQIFGGITVKDPTDPKYKQLAKESLQKYILESGNTHQYEVLKVESVTYQVVAGSLTRIEFVAKETDIPNDDTIKCHSKIWEQPWLNKKDITVYCQNVN